MRSVSIAAIAASASGKISEDAWGTVGDTQHGAAWVLDGATGLGDRQYVDGEYSDAQWYASEFSKALAEYSLQNLTAREVFARTIKHMAKLWQEKVPQADLPRYVLPSAAGVWLRWQNNEMEAVGVSDCRAWFISNDGKAEQLGFLDEDPNDAWLAEQIAAHQKNGVSEADMRDTVIDILRGARASMNTPGGYQILCIQPETADEIQVRKLPLAPGHVILCSDGLFRWSDVLRQGNANEFAAACVADLHGTLTHVRELENADQDCTRYTRLKRHDDATGIVLRVQ